MNLFEEMGLPEALNHRLQHMNFKTPTPIQKEAIPVALKGKDILGSAQTGSGKTGAFLIPLITRLINHPDSHALVMTPTRELATQVMGQLQAMLGRKTKINSALLIGGEPMPKQFRQLDRHPRVIVGTPGRINDHLRRKRLKLDKADFLVLDETDRMLDMGFSVQIDEAMKYMPEQRQTLLFSATLPKGIVQISKKYLQEPVRVAVKGTQAPIENIKQEVIKLTEAKKYSTLISQLKERQGSMVIFVNTKRLSEKIADKLSKEGYKTDALHGDLRQRKRDKVVLAFRKEKFQILVATDVASRGLDIPHIEHVINYDLPQCPEDYIHRIGRTARAGAKGFALNFVMPSDTYKWNAINRLIDPNFKPPKKAPGRKKRPFKDKKKFKGSKAPKSGKGAKGTGSSAPKRKVIKKKPKKKVA